MAFRGGEKQTFSHYRNSGHFMMEENTSRNGVASLQVGQQIAKLSIGVQSYQ